MSSSSPPRSPTAVMMEVEAAVMTGVEAAEVAVMTGVEAAVAVMTGAEVAVMTGAEVAGCPETSATRTDSQHSVLRATLIQLDKTQRMTVQNMCKCSLHSCSFGGLLVHLYINRLLMHFVFLLHICISAKQSRMTWRSGRLLASGHFRVIRSSTNRSQVSLAHRLITVIN